MAHTSNKKRIITIAGPPGSGKSTAARSIASMLGYEHFSSGDLFRALGKERGLDARRANEHAEGGSSDIDYLVDQRLREIGEEQDEVVIDSRLAWHWIPNSFKVYLDLDLSIAASRILKNIDKARLENEHIPSDIEGYAEELRLRLASENRRYKKFYDAEPYNAANYDLVIDTGHHTPEEVLEQLLSGYRRWLGDTEEHGE